MGCERGYIENPKTKGSGIICAIPQTGTCPMRCDDCFFQSGRSYLEPLLEHLPNMPTVEQARNRVVRVNDGDDSNNQRELVMKEVSIYENKFYNTSIPRDLSGFDAPVVLTINPAKRTDTDFYKLDPVPNNLMFVRMRTNVWNLDLVDQAVDYYTSRTVPVVLTFMAYYGMDIPESYRGSYVFRKRTLNSYNAITTAAWRNIMKRYEDNILVYSCGKIEGEKGKTSCKYCGNCLREYFATKERLQNLPK